MIQRFRAKNYGCLVDVTAALTPIHAFIGPNDSGKSTLLHGLRTVVQLAGSSFRRDADGSWEPFEPHLTTQAVSTSNGAGAHDIMLACDVDGGSYEVASGRHDIEERALRGSESTPVSSRSLEDTSLFAQGHDVYADYRPIMSQLASARLIRFDPDALRRPSGLIPEEETVGFLDDRGHGLPGVYFALRNRGDDVFNAVVDRVKEHFPTIRSLRVKAVTASTVALEIELQNGARIDAARMSEGLLYYLAFAALDHLAPVSLLLVEEPESGLHPTRIAEVVRILRAIVNATGAQVVMATHSPLVVNELEPGEVTVVTRSSLEHGTQLTPIKETHNFAKRASVYALGELWLSYADGVDEEPLLHGPEAR